MPDATDDYKPKDYDNEKVYPTLWSADCDAMWSDRPEPKRGTDEYWDKWWGDFPRQVSKVDWPEDESS